MRIEIELTPEGRRLLEGAPTTIQTQMVAAMQRMHANDRELLADLLERWLKESKIDFAAPPMLGEVEEDTAA